MLQHEGLEKWNQDGGYISARLVRRPSEKAGVSVFSIRILPSGRNLIGRHLKCSFLGSFRVLLEHVAPPVIFFLNKQSWL